MRLSASQLRCDRCARYRIAKCVRSAEKRPGVLKNISPFPKNRLRPYARGARDHADGPADGTGHLMGATAVRGHVNRPFRECPHSSICGFRRAVFRLVILFSISGRILRSRERLPPISNHCSKLRSAGRVRAKTGAALVMAVSEFKRRKPRGCDHPRAAMPCHALPCRGIRRGYLIHPVRIARPSPPANRRRTAVEQIADHPRLLEVPPRRATKDRLDGVDRQPGQPDIARQRHPVRRHIAAPEPMPNLIERDQCCRPRRRENADASPYLSLRPPFSGGLFLLRQELSRLMRCKRQTCATAPIARNARYAAPSSDSAAILPAHPCRGRRSTVLTVIVARLENAGFTVPYYSGLAMRKILAASRPSMPSCWIAHLPGEPNGQLALHAKSMHLPVVMMSGHIEAMQFADEHHLLLLTKPFRMRELFSAINRLCAAASLVSATLEIW